MYSRSEEQILKTIKSIQLGMDKINSISKRKFKIIHDFELRSIRDELIRVDNEIWDKVQDKS